MIAVVEAPSNNTTPIESSLFITLGALFVLLTGYFGRAVVAFYKKDKYQASKFKTIRKKVLKQDIFTNFLVKTAKTL